MPEVSHSGIPRGDQTPRADLDRLIADIRAELPSADSARASELGRRLLDLLDHKNAAVASELADVGTLSVNVDRGVKTLADAASSTELMQRACQEIARLCSARMVLLSRVDRDRIVPTTSFSAAPETMPALPDEFDIVPGSAEAQALATNTVAVETRVPDTLQETLGDNSFAIVPVIVCGRPAALVHVDTALDGPRRHALAAFAEVLGGCFERVGLETRRERQDVLLRESARQWSSAIDVDTAPSPAELTPARADRETEHRPLEALTDREADVVRLILTGASNAAIATELVITVDTVKSHVKHILRKLAVTNRAELIAQYRSAPR